MTKSTMLVHTAVLAIAVLLLASSSATTVNAFYIPGVNPRDFKKGEEVQIKVNALTSMHTQIPKDYYLLPFCIPVGGVKMASQNLGEFLTGNKIQNSPYTVNMLQDVSCKKVCQIAIDKKQVKIAKMHIMQAYHNNWIVDNLPSASYNSHEKGKRQHYAGGFSIGFIDADSGKDRDAYIYNHVSIRLDYHTPDPNMDGHRVVGFAVEPMSVNHKFLGGYQWDGISPEAMTKQLETCPNNGPLLKDDIVEDQILKEGEMILYTYDVIWKQSDVHWASRWDIYLSENGEVPAQVHWYSITNSILVVLFLSLLVVRILMKSLREDITEYIALEDLSDEKKEEEIDGSGWKLVHADVFRPPQNYPMIYCVMVGSGLQIGLSVGWSIIISAVGFVNPSRRGSLMMALLDSFMLFGILAGYVSSRLYKSFGGTALQRCTVLTATAFPGICFAVFLFFNTVLFSFHSSGCVPLLDVIIVAAMWCCVSIPLVFTGAFFGYKKDAITFPTETSTISRSIPPSTPLLNTTLNIFVAGLVPFATAYVELFFIMTSLWMDQYYYVFGFTLMVFAILLITCAEMTVFLVYHQLCSENHRWWWFSFNCGGSVGIYIFLYSIAWFRTLEASKLFITYLLYFGYMFLLSFAMYLITGMFGTLASFWFVRKIFSIVKQG